jgi:hypothetical protein
MLVIKVFKDIKAIFKNGENGFITFINLFLK